MPNIHSYIPTYVFFLNSWYLFFLVQSFSNAPRRFTAAKLQEMRNQPLPPQMLNQPKHMTMNGQYRIPQLQYGSHIFMPGRMMGSVVDPV